MLFDIKFSLLLDAKLFYVKVYDTQHISEFNYYNSAFVNCRTTLMGHTHLLMSSWSQVVPGFQLQLHLPPDLFWVSLCFLHTETHMHGLKIQTLITK